MRVSFALKAVISTGFACMLQTPSMAANFPTLEDPQLQGFLNTIQTEYQKYLNNKDVYFALPENSKTWPCKVSLFDLNAIAETLDSDEDPIQKKRLLNIARSTRSVPMRNVFTNQKFYPIQAECKSGKLEGPLEFWVEYDEDNIHSTLTVRHHARKYVRLSVKGNKPIGQVYSATLDEHSWYSSSKNGALVKEQEPPRKIIRFSASWATTPLLEQPPTVTFSHYTFNQAVSESLYTLRPLNGNRAEEIIFGVFGPLPNRHKLVYYKNGKKHGVETTYPGQIGGSQIPLGNACLEDGEKILTTNCSVD